jgi:hypothetical protein
MKAQPLPQLGFLFNQLIIFLHFLPSLSYLNLTQTLPAVATAVVVEWRLLEMVLNLMFVAARPLQLLMVPGTLRSVSLSRTSSWVSLRKLLVNLSAQRVVKLYIHLPGDFTASDNNLRRLHPAVELPVVHLATPTLASRTLLRSTFFSIKPSALLSERPLRRVNIFHVSRRVLLWESRGRRPQKHRYKRG